jgi:hypothetical protein
MGTITTTDGVAIFLQGLELGPTDRLQPRLAVVG